MTLLLLILLATMVGTVFAWYRAKTRGAATFIEEIRRFIALQNSKDVMALKATKRLLTVLSRVGDEQAQRLHERYHAWCRKQEEARPIHRTQKTQARQRRNPSQEHKRATRGDWINRNAHPNTPQWLLDLNKGVWEASLIYGVGSMVIVLLLILFIIGVNME